jgi:F-type H+-transporting ATPase subunit c
MTVVSAEVAEEKTKQGKINMMLPILAEVGGSLHVGLAALGAAIGVGLIGMGAASAVGRNPGAATPILVQAILAIAFAEAIVFYALYLAPK